MNQYSMLTLVVDDEIVLSTHEIDAIEQLFTPLELPNPDEKLVVKKRSGRHDPIVHQGQKDQITSRSQQSHPHARRKWLGAFFLSTHLPRPTISANL
ncbi:MAG: hypothetical protein LRY35_06190 [Clostridiales bacterium]|nr:hypothetical protein [Clostridiales bacterium]